MVVMSSWSFCQSSRDKVEICARFETTWRSASYVDKCCEMLFMLFMLLLLLLLSTHSDGNTNYTVIVVDIVWPDG